MRRDDAVNDSHRRSSRDGNHRRSLLGGVAPIGARGPGIGRALVGSARYGSSRNRVATACPIASCVPCDAPPFRPAAVKSPCVTVRLLARASALAFALVVASPSLADDPALHQKIRISIAHIGTLNAPNLRKTVGSLRDALEATGEVDVTLYGQGTSYADPTKFTELTSRGIVDIAFATAQFEQGRYPLNTLIGEPFIAPDHVTATKVYWSTLQTSRELQSEFASVHLMVAFCSSPEQFHAIRPIASLDDLRGVRVMTTNQTVMAMVRELGGSTVALPTSAQYEQLQKGVVGAVSNSWTGVYVFGTNEVTHGHLEVDSVMTPNFMIINPAKYAALPAAAKAVIDRFSTLETAVRFAEVWSEVDRLGRDAAIKRGADIVTLSPADRDAAHRRFAHLTAARIDALEKKGVPARKVFDAIEGALADQADGRR